jgi:type IV secretory pathway protease TraF
MRISTGHQKFLVAFRNENLFVDAEAKGYFSEYVRLSKNFSTSPSCDVCVAHRYRKINKDRRANSCEADEGIDSGFTGLLLLSAVSRLQPSLLGLRLMRLRAF